MGRKSVINVQTIRKAAAIVAAYTTRDHGWRGEAKRQIAAELQIGERVAHDLFMAALAEEPAATDDGRQGEGQRQQAGDSQQVGDDQRQQAGDGRQGEGQTQQAGDGRPWQQELIPASEIQQAYRDPSTGPVPSRDEMREELIRRALEIVRDPTEFARHRLGASKTLIDLYRLTEPDDEEDDLDPVEADRRLAEEITGILGLPADSWYLTAGDDDDDDETQTQTEQDQ